MPGHKRNTEFLKFDTDPVNIDVTEVHGTDNLQNPSGIIRDTEERAAKIYSSDKSYILANGSTGGIISAILSAVPPGGRLIMGRNCHMSAFSAVTLGGISPTYVYPQISEHKIVGPILAGDVKTALEANPAASAVFITSPTFEGIVSDIKTIAKIAHDHNALLIVDEAHGAHLKFHQAFPASALSLGADIVIQSLHKTLPSLTQTAVMHTKGNRCNHKLIRQFLNMVNSSSPSYVLLSSIGLCLEFLENSRDKFDEYVDILKNTRRALTALNNFLLIDENYMSNISYDISKLVLLTKNGIRLEEDLRKNHNLAVETCADNFIIAMTSVADTKAGFDRFTQALSQLDKFYEKADKKLSPPYPKPIILMSIREALYKPSEKLQLDMAVGRIAAENIAPYPPGIPICLPGELISSEVLDFLPKDYIFRKVNVLM